MPAARIVLSCWVLLAALPPPALSAERKDNAPGGKAWFNPRTAEISDKLNQRYVWRDRCGNNSADHQMAGGMEWERDNRAFVCLGEGWVAGQRRGGLMMLAFPDGNVLSAAWNVDIPKGKTFRIQYGLTAQSARSSTNGLKFTILATDRAGKDHQVLQEVLARGDGKLRDKRLRFDYAVRKITFIHDNLGKECWDVLWIHPEGLVVPAIPAAPRKPARRPARPAAPPKIDPRQANVAALRRAIDDLMESFPRRYPKGAEFLGRLKVLQERLAAAKTPQGLAEATRQIEALRREALIANPLVSGGPIVFVVRKQYSSHYHAVDMMFSSDEFNWDRRRMHREQFAGGGALKVLDPATGKVTTLVDVPNGVARDPDVHFDGKTIVFAMRKDKLDDYKIHEINSDPSTGLRTGGTGPRQLTFAKCVADIDPIYLPDETIVFSSTREPKYNMCSRDIAANLFRMNRDGSNIHQITRNTLVDNHSSLMPDGRILYARWEYVDRNFGDAHGLWTVNPDGTNQAIYWGNNTAVPGAVFNAHVIPGTGRTISIFGPHHDRLWGALAIFDAAMGIDGRPPVLRTWPGHVINTVRTGGPFACDTITPVRPKYEDPWPLADAATGLGAGKYFLVSRMVAGREPMGIFVVDVFGNEVLLHTEAPGCYDPVPLAPRKRPPVIPSRRNFSGGDGYLYLEDIYTGTHMRGVRRGSIKHLRVVESPPKKHWSGGSWGGQGYEAPGMNFHSFENKRILGTVPVEADGSAYFAVPSDRFVYFQALDENGMMVQSMRSGTVVQPGERTGCVGCHENRLTAPPARAMPLALRREPSRLTGWHGPQRLFNYAVEVQPVFDKHCVRCHDFDKPAGQKLILAGDKNPYFNASYLDLWSKRIITCVGGGPAEVRHAYSWGSHASRLTKVIRGLHPRHKKIKLSAEELDRVITWMDINGVYYPDYTCAYPDSCSGRSPLTNQQLARLKVLTGVDWFRMKSHAGNRGPRLSFDRPELSPCLKRFTNKNDPKYAEALAIIRAGKEMLAKRPRVDMPGFVPCEADRKRDSKYDLRRQIELRNRQAIQAGRRVYDDRPG